MSVVLKLKLTELKKSPSRISESKIPLITKKFLHLKDIETNYLDIKPKIPMGMILDVRDHARIKTQERPRVCLEGAAISELTKLGTLLSLQGVIAKF